MKKMADEKVKSTVRILLENAVQELLDDPAGAITSDVGLRKWVDQLQKLAKWVEQDWDQLLLTQGSEYERERLAQLLEEG